MSALKKVAAVIIALSMTVLTCVQIYAYEENSKQAYEKRYNDFAQALQEGDTEKVADILDTDNHTQFNYLKEIVIDSYKVEMIDYDGSYSQTCKAGIITLEISKSGHEFFPVGTTEYYICIDNDGMFGLYEFYPYNQQIVELEAPFSDIAMGSSFIWYMFNNIESGKYTDFEYNAGMIHYFYHFFIQHQYPDGLTEKQLTKEVNRFFGTTGNIDKDILDVIPVQEGKYFNQCAHGLSLMSDRCKRITRNRENGNYTFDIWYYSDSAYMNVCRKVKYIYSYDSNRWHLEKIECYYENEYEIYWA